MKKSTPYLLLLPALLFTVFVLVYPLVQNLINSVLNVSLIQGGSEWVGLRNYRRIFNDDLFWLAFRNTAIYAVAGTLLALLVGLGLAVLLNVKIGWVNNVAAFLYTIPWVVSPVVAGFAWKWVLNDRFGFVNHWLASAGIVRLGTSWLGDPHWALLCVIVARVWQFYPFAMVMFMAGLATIPQEQYDAAAVDGATTLRRFFSITLPNLKSVASVLLVLGVIWSFNDFNMVFVMTRGGPMDSSMVLPVLVRELSFVHFDLGAGSALSIVTFVLLVSLSTVYLKAIGGRDSA
jgi:multiple sugar transport system permease protein